MDLRLYGRVISRFRWLVVGGFGLAVLLTFLTIFKVSFSSPHVSWRQHKTYQATAQLLLTKQYGLGTDDPSHNAALYAPIINSDAIRTPVRREGALKGTYVATAVSGGSAVGILPLVQIDALAANPAAAMRLARSVSDAFDSYLVTSQTQQGIPTKQQIQAQTITAPNKVVVAKGRKFTIPIVIFLSTLVATLGLAFLLENLRPRAAVALFELEPAPEAAEEQEQQEEEDQRAATVVVAGGPESRPVKAARGAEASQSRA